MPRSHPYLFITSLLTLTCLAPPASAACRTKTIVQNNDEIAITVPFAVPVGVPVAPLAPYFYGYQQTYSPRPRSEGQMPLSDTAEKVASADGAPNADQTKSDSWNSAPSLLSSLVVTACAKCHGGQAPKAGLSLEHPEALSTVDRLRTIHAVATGQMPKGNRLSSKDAQAIIAELANMSQQSKETSPHTIGTRPDE